ncbi:MAG TPA: glycosyltransferase, partial [Anaerohalosphaeraceae bacterium]|nr:glycosyltransferase [Anaerohalosphaeraceae bacterium]
MRLVFFDFIINFGGGPQGSVYLARRLNAHHPVTVIDGYGYCREYCQAVQAAGLPLRILYPKDTEPYIGCAGRPVRRFFRMVRQLPELIQIGRRLEKTILEIDPSVIWVNNFKSLSLLAWNPRLCKYPLVVYFRGWGTPEQISRSFLNLLKGPRVSAVIAHARATYEQLRSQGVPEEKLSFTPNTVPFEEILERAKEPLHAPLPRQDGYPKMLLPAARPVREKGHHTAIEAVALLKERGYKPVLWLPGKTATGASHDFENALQD